ncbi:chloride channel protein [Ornithobacterium rhinotracheale]|uniref:Chloride channel protein EriC n=1 Tax=Ornithobacterium rhinotracheale (strain ATCC 51463 / DSM 15997 / CCUG 23171 / CIP 104009 / LMG 9086) TaxID=867902 RepID=I4A3A6_ORNRL|nr:chloride channel protein [Ornithobacterium rhinotracheale]AFL98440.1 chloride channel protein EriC [Ornithobacterium rhinotracheale DSM 15997]AIQ00172.1 chloride channel protein [Ornithobacterium rhinotracheale ORT-UMN 88]KGB65760.1 chloride channel protein [Ornithobacterium rhinotracheale H06-030791]MCK0193212.1 chloride channel protein [Ornithobacterium rhinotracheale]MCK0200817.1 chloride channel protein [Ornithobacterium rhinotracheale]
MQKVINFLRYYLRLSTDRIHSHKIKNNLLQAIPFWVGAVITGLFAIFYASLFRYAEEVLAWILGWHKWLIFILLPSAFLISWWLVVKFAPYAKGSGIPQVMAAVELSTPKNHKKIPKLLSLRVLCVKIISSAIMVVGGGAIGREGPTIQISGSIYKKINELLPASWPKISRKNMIMTGAAAGLSAAFNTPLGGIVFAIEELTRTHLSYFKTALFTGVIIAGFLTQSITGPYLYLGFPRIDDISSWIIFSVLLVAVISGILSSLLSQAMLSVLKFKKTLKTQRQEVYFLLASSLIIATLAYFISEDILGSGKELMERVLFTDEKTLPWYVPILRMVGTGLSFTSGAAGGIFAPALGAGATVGSVVAGWFAYTSSEINLLILVGMVSFLVGITRAPFTSAILVIEMTDRHSLIFYLMFAGLVASFVAFNINRHSFYDVLKMGYLKDLNDEDRKEKATALATETEKLNVATEVQGDKSEELK